MYQENNNVEKRCSLFSFFVIYFMEVDMNDTYKIIYVNFIIVLGGFIEPMV